VQIVCVPAHVGTLPLVVECGLTRSGKSLSFPLSWVDCERLNKRSNSWPHSIVVFPRLDIERDTGWDSQRVPALPLLGLALWRLTDPEPRREVEMTFPRQASLCNAAILGSCRVANWRGPGLRKASFLLFRSLFRSYARVSFCALPEGTPALALIECTSPPILRSGTPRHQQ